MAQLSYSLKMQLQSVNRLPIALALSQILALIWWLVALYMRSLDIIPVWRDQIVTFTAPNPIDSPYGLVSFIYPPWAAILFAPLSWLPLTTAILIQLCLYFAVVTMVVYKFGGDIKAVAIALTSFIAFDSALELNIEWLVYLGLLVPPAFSGPLLAIKPQLAFGYWLTLKRRDLVHAIIVLLATVLVSLLIWGPWPIDMIDAIKLNTLGRSYHLFNLAPLVLLPAPVSIAIGVWMGWRAVKRHDVILGFLAWLFFVPYIASYSLLLPLALIAVRLPRFALLVTVVIWVIYGGTIARYLLHF